MGQIPIIFQNGQNEGIEKKVLPQGWFTSAKNTRFRKDGRMGKREGYRTRVVTTVSAITHELPTEGPPQALGTTKSALQWLVSNGYLFWWKEAQTSPTVAEAWTTAYDSAGDPYTLVSHVVPGPKHGVVQKATSIDTCMLGTTQVTAWTDGSVWIRLENPDNGGTVLLERVANVGTETEVRLVATTFGGAPRVHVVWRDGTSIRAATYSSSAQTAAPLTIFGIPIVGAGGFDCIGAPGRENWQLVFQESATQLRVNTLDGSRNTIFSDTFLHGAGGEVQPTVTRSLDAGINGRIWVAYRTLTGAGPGVIYGRVYADDNLSAAAATPVTSLDTTATNDRRPSLVVDDATHAYMVFSRTVTNQPRMAACRLLATGTPTVSVQYSLTTVYELRHASKPCMKDGRLFVWAYGGRANSVQPGFFLVDLNGVSAGAPDLVMRHAYGSAFDQDHPTQVVDTGSRLIWAYLEITKGLGNDNPAIGAALLDFYHFTHAGKHSRSHVSATGGVYLSGGFLAQFDGRSTVESGFLYAPEIISLTESNGAGALTTTGTYRYVVVWFWVDDLGLLHSSEPSAPMSITLTGVNDTVTVVFTAPALTLRGRHGVSIRNPYAIVYRTANGGRTYTQVTPDNAGVLMVDGQEASYLDVASDASMIDNDPLYTQNGDLPNVMPPACGQVWRGSERLAVALLADANTVQVSKIIVPVEPVVWADHDAFRLTVADPVTAVAALDGQWIVFTKKGITSFAGEGPDDKGIGSFAAGVAIPTETGCNDWRSVIEVPQGLLFQGTEVNRIYLLPRGGGAPQWVGQNVRDTLANFPVITGVTYVAADDCVVFTCVNTAGTDSRLIVLDLRNNAWTVDNFEVATPAVLASGSWNGRLGLAAWESSTLTAYIQTAGAFTDVSTDQIKQILNLIATPFGLDGFGRVRELVQLGEYRSDATLTVEAFFDSETSSSSASWQVTAANGYVAGGRVELQWDLPRQKLTSIELQLTDSAPGAGSPGEGLVFHGVTLDAEAKRGLARRPASARA